jgi:hypothetical protein
MLYHAFKNITNVYWESKEDFYKNTQKTFEHKDYSRVEYFTILPSNKNEIIAFTQISNNSDSREIKYTVYRNDIFEKQQKYTVTGKFHSYNIIPFNVEDKVKVRYDIYDLTGKFIEQKEFKIDNDYINNNLKNNGLFKWLK